MAQRDSLGSKDCRKERGSIGIDGFLHLCACICGPIVTVFLLFQVFLSVANALQDVNKYEHTGTFAFFLYFLNVYGFTTIICVFLLAATEMLLYIVLYRRAEKGITHWGSICYFSVMMLLHIMVWFHANTMPSLDLIYDETFEAVYSYFLFAKTTALPAVLYAVSYVLCMRTNSK